MKVPHRQQQKRQQYQPLMLKLSHVYPPRAQIVHSLEQMQQRFMFSRGNVVQDQISCDSMRLIHRTQDATSDTFNTKRSSFPASKSNIWPRRLSTLAACAFVALLVGTLVFLLKQAHSGHTGGVGNSAMQFGAFVSLHMIDAATGWAFIGKTLVRTTDGGSHWKNVTPTGVTLTVGSLINALNAENAWLVIPSPLDPTAHAPRLAVVRIFRTSDGGQSWQNTAIQISQIGMRIAQITFVNTLDGWMLANQGGRTTSELAAIYRSTDGGKTWISVSTVLPASTDTPPPGRLPYGGSKAGISFLNASTGWVTGMVLVPDMSRLYMTHDGGLNWYRQRVPLPPGVPSSHLTVLSPTFFSATDGILPVKFTGPVTDQDIVTVIYTTHNGGSSWQSTTPLSTALSTVNFVDMQHGWATDGTRLFVTRDGGQHWTKVAFSTAFQKVTQLDFVSSTLGWASSGKGLLKTSDGGQTWRVVSSTSS